MNKLIFFTLATFLLMPLAALHAAEVVNLRCEYLTDPLGIDVVKPRLSWVMEDRGQESGSRGLKQTAYQVLVASSEELLRKDQGNLWDSGKVVSDQSIHVEYAGKPLESQMLCYWKVKTCFTVGGSTVQESDWSKPALWSMGLLKPEDWSGAQWIGDDAPKDIPSPLLRKSFVVNKAVKRALVYATAHGAYELYLNGKRVGDHILAPGWTDYRKHVLYQTYNVTSGLDASGENVLGGMLGDGWYNAALFTWPARPANGSDARKLLLKFSIEYVDGSITTIVSDQSWSMWRDGPVRNSSIYHGETVDARKFVNGWDKPNFDASTWMKPQIYTVNGATLAAQKNEPIRVVMELKPVKTTQPNPGVVIFDMGQNMVGWCRVKLSGPAGTKVSVRHGELLNADGTLYTANLRGAAQRDEYILNGADHVAFEPHFTYHGFRYVEVTGVRDATNIELTGRVFHSDASLSGSFTCSNPLLDKIWNNTLWSQRGNFMSVPTDCPQRTERMGWAGDALVFAQTAMFNMDLAAFFSKWIQDLRDAQLEAGGYTNFAPSFEKKVGSPGWADIGAILPWRVFENYGDIRLLKSHYLSVKKYVTLLQIDNASHIRPHGGFADWLDGSTIKHTGYPSGGSISGGVFGTAFYFSTVQAVACMADALGETDDANKYHALAEDIRTAFNRSYVKPTGEIEGNSQAGYALALNVGLLPENLRSAAARRMNDLVVTTYDTRLSTGLHTTPMLLLELSRWGYHQTACALMESRRFPSLGYQIDQGATTTWERWDANVEGKLADPGGNSLNHFMFGAVCEWMYRVVLGINPDPAAPGYQHVIIKPQPGGTLTWAKGSYRSIHGLIVSNWKRDGAQLIMEVTIPANTAATIFVPAKDAAGVTESGGKIGEARAPALSKVEGVKFLRMEANAAVYEVGSGIYRFQSSLTEAVK
jgi:alpha-L-rhamnosidase